MSCYLYPELASKAAYKKAIASGQEVIAKDNHTERLVETGKVDFEGPHFPKPHKYYGTAIVENGKVVKVT